MWSMRGGFRGETLAGREDWACPKQKAGRQIVSRRVGGVQGRKTYGPGVQYYNFTKD